MDILLEKSLLEILAYQWGMNVLRYFALAGGAWLVFWKWLYPKWKAHSLYTSPPDRRHRRREISYSLLTTFIFLGPVALVLTTSDSGLSQVYSDLSDQGWWWYVMSYPILFFWHETYFYWVHRFMHWKPIYKRVHHIHHLSTEPTPFAAFSFHPLEAILESGAIVIIAFILPLHLSTLILFTFFSLVMNVYGHLGIEIWKHDGRISRYINSPRYHAWHHKHYRGNYSLYLNFWDRWMRTTHDAENKKPS